MKVKEEGFYWLYFKMEKYLDENRDTPNIKYLLDFLANSSHEEIFSTDKNF